MTFDHANFNFTLTLECNYKCEYCLQGTFQNEKKFLNFKMFSLIIDKIFKSKLKSLDITLMGGELSTDEKYLEYFEYLFKKQLETNIHLCINFLSNYSVDSFFKKLINLHKTYSSTTLHLDLTLHKDYSTNYKKIISRLKEDILYINKNFTINISFLENFSIISKKNSYYKNYKEFGENINNPNVKIIFSQLRNFKDCPPIKNPGKRLCNALYYLITPDGKIIDPCRNITTTFLSFKIVTKVITCNKPCPCPFLKTEFTQVIINE